MKANLLIFTSGVGVIHIQWLRFDFYIVLFSSPFSRFDIMHFCQVGNSRRQTQTIEGTVYPRFDRTFYLWVRQLFFISRQMINLHLQWPRWYVGGPRGLNLWWKQWHRGGQCAHGKGECRQHCRWFGWLRQQDPNIYSDTGTLCSWERWGARADFFFKNFKISRHIWGCFWPHKSFLGVAKKISIGIWSYNHSQNTSYIWLWMIHWAEPV